MKTTKIQSAPSSTDIKRLFALSGNRCAFPKCQVRIVDEKIVLGEVCHIHAARPQGPRYDPAQTEAERHGFGNLILMCANHHKVIDDDEEGYPANRLRRFKADHETGGAAALADRDNDAFRLLLNETVHTTGQQGGIAAHTVHAETINFHAPSRDSQSISKSLEGIQTLWDTIIRLREAFCLVTFADTILTTPELEACFCGAESNDVFQSLIPFADLQEMQRRFDAAGVSAAERQRPFVSSAVFSAFQTYQSLVGRSAVLVQFSFRDRRYHNWRYDAPTYQILESALERPVIEALRAKSAHGLTSTWDAVCERFLLAARS